VRKGRNDRNRGEEGRETEWRGEKGREESEFRNGSRDIKT
jgi:hypothetical protein